MRNNNAKTNTHRSARQTFLESPVGVLPLPPDSGRRLAKMGFKTVKEAFRAALVGRISARKNGGLALEDAVLMGGCISLGHPILTKTEIRDFQALTLEETVGEAIFRFNGQRITLSPELLTTSARSILLPATMHQGIEEDGITSLAELLETKISKLLNTVAIKDLNLGLFLAHIFDYIFILNEQENAKSSFAPETLHHPPSSQTEPESSPLLSTWLDKDMHQAGLELLHNKQLADFLFFRNTAGALIRKGEETSLTYLTMAASPENPGISQVHTAVCESCSPEHENQPHQCPHQRLLHLQQPQPLHPPRLRQQRQPSHQVYRLPGLTISRSMIKTVMSSNTRPLSSLS